MATNIISIVNQKGGVGKTTTVINIASYLALKGRSVLIVDLDPQANATSGLGISKENIIFSSYDIFNKDQPSFTAFTTRIKNLDIIPSDTNLSGVELEIMNLAGREYILKTLIENLGYNYIFIDCPPSLGLLTINALTASTAIIVPVQTEYYALEGLGQLLATFQAIKASTNPNLEILGVLLTMYDKRTTLSNQVREEIFKYFNELVFETNIPRNIRLAEAPSFGQTIFEHDKWSKGSKAYKNLAKEILDRTKPN
jgi:chromosome partitioning protein